MCEYVQPKELNSPKNSFDSMIKKVQSYIKKEYKITFSYLPIGSGSRNMVIRKCNEQYFDLDYQITMQKIPKNYDWNKNCKEFKDIFRNAFNKFKPKNFKDCEDSTQALTMKNLKNGYGFDIIITTYSNDNFYILYNKKNTNDANNNDYFWAKKSEMKEHRERLNKVKGPEMWDYLRKVYKKKRHNHKDDQEPNKKKSYQILNEAVVETLKNFGIDC